MSRQDVSDHHRFVVDRVREYGPVGMQIVTNRVDRGHVRLYYGALGKSALFSLDFVLRRGARHVEFKWTALGGAQDVAGVGCEADVVGGVHDVHVRCACHLCGCVGQQVLHVVTDGGDGRHHQRAAAVVVVDHVVLARGGRGDGGAGAGFDQFTDLVYQYMGALRTRQRAVIG